TTPNWYQCNSGPITFFNATPFDQSGKYEYPVHLSKALIIKSDINNPKTSYGSPGLKQTTNIWSWTTTCSWSSVPTFGMLKNLDACTNGIPMPNQDWTSRIGHGHGLLTVRSHHFTAQGRRSVSASDDFT
ncbi:hypothetical protein OSTOST_05128, partial [Ostertagia ostertagi]